MAAIAEGIELPGGAAQQLIEPHPPQHGFHQD
jgi:hypothetical protein